MTKLLFLYYYYLLFCLFFSLRTQAQLYLGTDEGSLFKRPKLVDYDSDDPDIIQNEVIVIFDEQYMDNDNNNKYKTLRSKVFEMMRSNDGGSGEEGDDDAEILNVYENVLQGAVIRFQSKNRLRAFVNNRKIKYASMNARFSLASFQSGAVWNLDRIDQTYLPLDDVYRYTYNGTGVTVFVMDTGIRSSHSEFVGRVTCGYDAYSYSRNCDDLNGHGTHVAGIIGGRTYGVAKNATLVAVKVLGDDGSARASDVIAGFDYILGQRSIVTTPMVVNLSLVGRKYRALNEAANNVVKAGVPVVTAAGNDGLNACFYSPASAELAITVGATDYNDHVSFFSNIGRCISLFGPGTDIMSSSNLDDNSTSIKSGTSMASPHVSGVIALYLEKNPSSTPAEIKSLLRTNTLKDKIKGLQSAGLGGKILQFFMLKRRESPNLLINTMNL